MPETTVRITAAEIKKQIKAAIKEFGRYSYVDKGPSEVMNLVPIREAFEAMEPKAVADVLADVRMLKDFGDQFVAEMLVDLQESPKLEAIYEDKRISDLF